MRSGFFNSVNNDRLYDAGFFAEYFATFIGNGVFPNPSNNLQVYANDDMNVTLGKGSAWINGYVFFNDTDHNFKVSVADGVLSRIDRVVVQFDTELRTIDLVIKEGAPSGEPVAPLLQRDPDRYELALADISINAGATSITQADIRDLRMDKELCGIVHGVVDQVDTTAIFEQFESWYSQTKDAYNSEVSEWTEEKQVEFNLWYSTKTSEFENEFNDWYFTNITRWDDDFTTWFQELRERLEGDVVTNLEGRVLNLEKDKAEKIDLERHISSSVMDGEVHDIRVVDKSFQYFDGKDWITVNEGFKVGNTEAMKVEQKPALKIEISWSDPKDSIVINENQDEIILAKWAGSELRAKLNSYPVDEKDGVLLENNIVRDKYKETPYTHEGLINGDKWYYMVFPYTENGVYTIDPANRGEAIATNKLAQSAPPAPVISNIEFDRARVAGGDLVSLNKTTWRNSPHTFTGLTEETTYTAYAKKKETNTHLESPISAGKTFKTPLSQDDHTDSVGPKDLIAGDMQAGYFGVVPASELFTGTELANLIGISQGTAQFDNVGWLKFAIDGKIIYKSQKTYRHSISWDHINSKGAVDGTKKVSKNGTEFKVRLMKGALTNPSKSSASDRGAKGSEWNRLMLPIHVEAKSKNWAYPAYVENSIPYWGIDFTDADLQTHYNHGNGAYHWCQETTENASSRLFRGYYGVSYSFWGTSSATDSHRGWSPVLEVFS